MSTNSRAVSVSVAVAVALLSFPLDAWATPPATDPAPAVGPPVQSGPALPPMPGQPPLPVAQPQAQAVVQPQPQAVVQPQPQPEPPAPVAQARPEMSDFAPTGPSHTFVAGSPQKRITGGILLGAGVTFAAFAGITFAGKAGQTEIGSQGLNTFDNVGYALQPRIPRVVMGSTFTVAGALMAGFGAKLFASNAGVANDPVTTLKRQRRLRSSGAILVGSGGAVVVSSLALIFYGAGEWGSIPPFIGDFRPEYAQSAHNAASFFSYGAGLLAVGVGTLATGLGLLSGNSKAIRAGMMADRNGGGVILSGQF